MPESGSKKRVLVLGGGFGGAYAAQRLSKGLPDDWSLTLVDRNNYLLFYPLLVEACVGSLEPRHVVVPLRKFLRHGEMKMAEVIAIDLESKTVRLQVVGSDARESLAYDHLILATGSITKPVDIPGLQEHSFQLKGIADGVDLRDRGIRLLELANTIEDAERRKGILRVVAIGANYTGVEFAGEYQAFLRRAARSYEKVSPGDISMVLLEQGERILNTLDPELAAYAHRKLTRRGLSIRTGTSVTEVAADHVVLTTGERLDTRTTVWCAGIAPNPLVAGMPGLPKGPHGYVVCGRDFRVEGWDGVWAIGDIAAVPDEHGKPYAATAQNATREGRAVADNVLAAIAGRPTRPFNYGGLGAFAALGCRTAVAKVLGVKLSGFAAWFLYRTVYLFKMPGWSRKLRIMMDWTVDLFAPAEPVQLGIHRVGAEQDAHAERASLR